MPEKRNDGKRIARLQESYMKELAEIVLTRVNDPRLVGVYVTQVKFTPDLRLAKVYFSVDGGRLREREVIAGFERSKGYLKRELSSKINIKYTPDLKFYYDDTDEFSDKMDELFVGVDVELENEEG